ncbi:helicase-related protein [Candidatus Stoquefichus sp. SB1]|uniref:helicase-related protein n=1 Tax=Candidatus Stoquefichus sp. SB1 TaxID=1658109 RepID=UPI00067E902C|nr:helicase-related protein [Candidatus Stoquefichus sp. SB1]
MNYEEFIRRKKVVNQSRGIEINENDLNSVLFDYQKAIVKKALELKRFCLFEACGMGKTLQQIEWAYQVYLYTKKPVLIIAPLGVTIQTAKEEAPKLGYKVYMLAYEDHIKDGINIINYEQLDNVDCSVFGGVVLDESSILKNFTGKVRTKLSNYFKDTEYKLCCTATPAPNDLMELLNHADFLGVTTTAKALATYFINDMKTGTWRLKGHATKEFYRWCCTWSINIESPKDLGFKAEYYKLPNLIEKNEIIEIDVIDDEFESGLFREIGTSATSFHKEKSRTADKRAKRCAEIASKDNEQYLIWCDTNQEADLLKKYIPDAVEVRGSDKPSFKEDCSMLFKNGQIRVLISKPKIFGYGMNFQKCHNVIFCGLTYSYENYFQALRRIYRFGQKNDVYSYIVIGSTELHILENIKQKQQMQEQLKNKMDISVKEIQLLNFEGKEVLRVEQSKQIEIPEFL